MSHTLAEARTPEQSEELPPPFMRALESGWTDFWTPPKPEGSYAANVALGESYAEMAVMHARARNDPLVLELIVSTITSKAASGKLAIGPIELGFFHKLSSLAYVGSLN
ncbi:hypothetical protein [Bradyrhizobium manausense]|uniref:Uncharacterized protein n=1 Tax=Bradyrhizobium manausense TaxID=989370 RepID=A0A0R3D6T3_9BRAD|nr:hypothetical protein [Bradyrhizobium manausense]KRQ03340.1 hypothetical protein AOQ71_31955 [Bradyrhizobium manausense]